MSPSPEDYIPELLRRIKAGDRPARRELFALLADETRFGAAVVAAARHLLPPGHCARRQLDTGDVVQSALLNGMVHIEEFRGTTEGELYSWLRAIIRTKVHRASRHRDELLKPGSGGGREGPHGQDAFKRLVERELVEALRAAVTRLPLAERLVIELRLRGKSTEEIARHLNLQRATVRKRESRAVAELRKRVH